MIKKKSSHFICAWQWLMLSSETMRRKLEIQKLEQVFRFFSFSFIPPLFLNIVLLNQDEFFEIYLLLLTCRGWLMLSYLVRSDFMDSSLSLLDRTYSPGCRIGGSFLISDSVKGSWSCVLQWKAIFQFLIFKSLQYLEYMQANPFSLVSSNVVFVS